MKPQTLRLSTKPSHSVVAIQHMAGSRLLRNAVITAAQSPIAREDSSLTASTSTSPSSSSTSSQGTPFAVHVHGSSHSEPSSNGHHATNNGSAEHAIARSQGLRVSVKGVHKRYQTKRGEFHAVRGVDLEIEPGTLVALLGPSGSGKTTLLRMIAGLEEVTEGQVFFGDEDATNMTVQERRIGFVFQSYALFRHMTVLDNIVFGMNMRGIEGDKEAKEKRARELLELIQLPHIAGRFPPQLSGGQRQRVAVARALASEPRMLLMDEPFGALDPVVRGELRTQLRELQQKLGLTTIIVTHDQEEAFDLADRVVVFNRGTVEQVGTPAELCLAPKTPFVANFVGDVNVVPRDSLLIRKLGFRTDKESVLVRPGDIEMFRIGDEPPGETRLCPATVIEKIHMGWAVHYKMEFDDQVAVEWLVPRDDDDDFGGLSEEDRVYLHVPPEKLMGANPDDIDFSVGKK